MAIEQLSSSQFERFQAMIYKRSGIRIGDGKVSLLSNRIRRRLRACGFDDFESYFGFLTSPESGELDHLLDAITTNETFFFRTEMHFRWLKSTFIPEVVAAYRRGERTRTLRFWSAACASGAEPYSIAICLAENSHRLSDWSLSVLGTDISQQELSKAREAVFKARTLESLSAQQLRRFFHTTGDDTWQAKPMLRQAVRFAQHNLMQPINERTFDCIFLCNVLIYFDRESKQQVVNNIVKALAPAGYLVVGPSEGVFDLLGGLTRKSPSIYQKA